MAQPLQQVPPLVPPAPTLASNRTFVEYYNDASVDEFHGNYTNVMTIFTCPGDPTVTPASIRELVTNDPNNSSLGYLFLVADSDDVNDVGLLYGVHNVAKYATRLGHPATPWDNKSYGSLHDVTGNQIPTTVLFPSDTFTKVGAGANYTVPNEQLMAATYAADPNLALVGPFVNNAAGTELVSSRNTVGIPHRYMRHFIPGPLTPRQGWEIVAQDIIANGDQVPCAALFKFLLLACTLCGALDSASPLARDEFIVPLSDANLTRHRAALVEHKLPGLNQTPTLAAGQAIAASVSELATEQRAYHQDMADREAQKSARSVSDYFGAAFPALLRLCHASTEAALPPVYQTLALHGRKKHRSTMQRAMTEMLMRLGLEDLQCVITADLATKVTDFNWTNQTDDLEVGIHPFAMGEMDPATIVALNSMARQYDMITLGSVSPNLADCQSLLVGSLGKVSIPTSLIMLDAQNHIFMTFLYVFLGSAHPVATAWALHTQTTKSRLMMLQNVKPVTPGHAFLLPALLQRWAQLRWNHWLKLQQSSMTPVMLQSPWTEIWNCIELQTPWESPLPERYLGPVVPPMAPFQGSTALVARPSVAVSTASAAITPAAVNTAEVNLAYNEAFAPYKETGKRIRDILKKAVTNNNHLPKNSSGVEMCVSYHVKGICNLHCGRKADHKAHTAADTKKLVDWCVLAFAT